MIIGSLSSFLNPVTDKPFACCEMEYAECWCHDIWVGRSGQLVTHSCQGPRVSSVCLKCSISLLILQSCCVCSPLPVKSVPKVFLITSPPKRVSPVFHCVPLPCVPCPVFLVSSPTYLPCECPCVWSLFCSLNLPNLWLYLCPFLNSQFLTLISKMMNELERPPLWLCIIGSSEPDSMI